MIPSPSSSGVLRRMLIEASPHIRCSDEDQSFAEGQRIEHSDIECHLEDIQVHGRMDGVDAWSNVIADTMLSMSASPRPQNELVFHQRRSVANVSTLANDSDSDAPQDLQLSPNGMDDDEDEDDDDRDNILSMSMDQDSQDLNESASSALSRLAEDSGILGHASHVPRKKGRPAKFAVAGALKSGAECPVCGKVFNNSSALAKHKLTHSSERKYVCRLCEKTFKRQDHLNGHMLTHSSKKPFECRFPSCGRSYCDARSLRRHHDNYHLRLPDTSGVASRPSSAEGLLVPPLSALQAERLMASSTSSLSPAGSEPTRDMGTVSNSSDSSSLLDLELAHECELCGRRFKNLPALNGHMRLHGGYYKKDMVITSSIEAAKHATRLEPKLTLSPGCRITVSDPNLLANCVHTSDSQWSVPGLLLSAAAHTSSSHGENMSNPANPLYRTPSASQVIVSSGVAGIAHNSILQSSGLLQVDPAQLGFLLSQKCLTSSQSANATDFRAVNQLKSERDPMVLTQKTMSSVPHVKVEDGFKRAVDNVEFFKKYGHLSTHDYTSAANQTVHLSNRTDRDKIVLVKQDAMSSHEASTYKPLTINTDSESMFRFLPTHRETAQSYPAIHQLLQRCNLKVTDILEKESLHKSEIHRVHVDSSHSASCRDKLCTGCRRWTVSDSDKMFGHQHLDATHSFVQPGSHLLRQDSVGFEPHDRNPLALLQEVAEAVDARDNLFPDDSGSYGDAYDEAVFPTPALSGLYHKFRRKNRPEPLIIPAPVTHFGFQSRLRSPRIIADQPAAPVPVTSAPQPNVVASTSTFMPYTPPPMLSPLRTGSGLFCSLVQPSPKSAPVGLRLGLFRNTVADSGSNGNQVVTALPPPFTIKEEEEEEEEEVEEAEEIIDIPVIETEEEIHEVDLAPPPQTDISPHINIGSEYQADIPTFSADRRDAVSDNSLSDLLWDPALMKNISESDVQHYMDFACCSAIPNCGTNKEFALHLLHLCRGDIKAAALKLMRVEPSLPKSHSLHSYKYAETVSWTSDEIELYQQAMIKFDKDFFRVSQQVETKSVRECTEFYFLWKKVCVDEWRRIRLIRRKRINLRSAAQQPKLTTSEELCPPSAVNDELCQQGDNRSDVSGAEGVISREAYSRPAPRQEVVSAASELFPCRICGKVFDRVKSRSAHMKSHRQIDSETQH